MNPPEPSKPSTGAPVRRAGGIEVVVRGRDLVVYAVPESVDEVIARFMEAGSTLVRTALGPGDMPAEVRSAMPAVQAEWVAYGAEEARVRPAHPEPAAIDRMYQVLGWLMALVDDDRTIVWGHYMMGHDLRRVRLRLVEPPKSHVTVSAWGRKACGKILRQLHKGAVQIEQKQAA